MRSIPRVARTCAICGRQFFAGQAEVLRGRALFCSKSCAAKSRTGEKSPGWNGGRTVHDGYVCLSTGEREHVIVAERALGRALPRLATVHHVNEIRSDNRNGNLVICQDQAYHMLLHALRRVHLAGGRPFLDAICSLCKAVKPRTEFSNSSSRGRAVLAHECRPCAARLQRERKQRRRVA